jgi:hypothetical protein
MSFTEKRLSYTFAVEGGSSPINISGLRSSCRIVAAGAPTAGGQAVIAIYGMSLSQMNSLTIMSTRQFAGVKRNEISIFAGDSHGMSLIYKGNVFAAWADARAMPEVCFRIEATVQSYIDVQNVKPTSVKGTPDALRYVVPRWLKLAVVLPWLAHLDVDGGRAIHLPKRALSICGRRCATGLRRTICVALTGARLHFRRIAQVAFRAHHG